MAPVNLAEVLEEKAKAAKLFEVMSRFTNHTPSDIGLEDMRSVRRKVRELATLIQDLCPESREKATALTQLVFVMHSANSAIAQQYAIDEKDV